MCRDHQLVEVGVVVVHTIRTVDTNPIAVALAVVGRMRNRMLVDIVAAHTVADIDDEIDDVHTPLLLLLRPTAVCGRYLDLPDRVL